MKSQIISFGASHGEQKVAPRELLEEARFDLLDFPLDTIEKDMGIFTVHHCALDTRPSALAVTACEQALEKTDVPMDQIDALIYCGIDCDYSEPATAHVVAAQLGIQPGLCWDTSNACHGLTAGLIQADHMIRLGEARYVLVCTGERTSLKTQNILERFRKRELGVEDIAHHLGIFTVGDAGGALLMGPSDGPTGISRINTKSIPRHTRLCFWDDFISPPVGAMVMGKISVVTINLVKKMATETLNIIQWERNDIDIFLPHQVGRRIFESYLDIFSLPPEKAIATYPHYGNVTSATIPVCLDELSKQNRLLKGRKIYTVSTGSGIVVSQFGINI